MVTLVRALINNRINLKVRGGTGVVINSQALCGCDCNDKSDFCRASWRTISFLCSVAMLSCGMTLKLVRPRLTPTYYSLLGQILNSSLRSRKSSSQGLASGFGQLQIAEDWLVGFFASLWQLHSPKKREPVRTMQQVPGHSSRTQRVASRIRALI